MLSSATGVALHHRTGGMNKVSTFTLANDHLTNLHFLTFLSMSKAYHGGLTFTVVELGQNGHYQKDFL